MVDILGLLALSVLFLGNANAYSVPLKNGLTQGIEHLIQLTPHTETRLFFKMPGKNYPLWMFVTPCGASVHWQLFIESGFDSPVNLHPSSEQFNHILHKRIPPLLYVPGPVEKQILLAGEQDDKRMSYYTNNVESEWVTLTMMSDKPTTTRVFLTTIQSQLEAHYPPLPDDLQLAHSIVPNPSGDDQTVQVSWQIPAKIKQIREPARYRFCAVVSRKQPDYTFCDELGENLESIHCVNQTTNHLNINSLRSGRKYFVTVFIRDQISGGTSALRPIEVHTPESPTHGKLLPKSNNKYDETFTLFDAQLQAGKLKAEKGDSQLYDFPVHNLTERQKVLLVVHACDGYIRVAIYRDGRLLRKSDPFSGFRRFLVLNAQDGELQIQIINADSNPKMFRLWASMKPEKSPYPQLPDDTSIKEIRRTCDSTTLQWLRAFDGHVRYCLYRRKESVNYLEELVSKHANLCAGTLPEKDLVGCYDQEGAPGDKDDDDRVVTIRVDRLEPDTTYRFDLLARPVEKTNSQDLPYRTVWVKTRASC
ncbi:hypothetical protein QR680_003112 [Steinernema hermaphroditum]|uniref:Fibronectin type-III domain-containing protein n=1 Tax=Steinernema hermaphroditum TaxID=289476 RepID=A0AA39H7B8_9BILA|nr:hypothetical protein QR680_003112 [Steinernema hermaphroditum]